MNLLPMWRTFLISVCIQAGVIPLILCETGTIGHLSKEDILLLKDEEKPPCFTRTGEDFTCFLETADNRTLDFLYQNERASARCNMSVYGTEEGTFLHICHFPNRDVPLFSNTEIKVVERANNTIYYSRNVYMEDHFLLRPPFKVSLKSNDCVGQLNVSWEAEVPKYVDTKYKIRYSGVTRGENSKQTEEKSLLLSLVPGEQVEVQVAVRSGFSQKGGHWSSWSPPVRASVPQSTGEISLVCSTPDLHSLTCTWNGTRYGAKNEKKLFYKMAFGDSLNWTDWTECLTEGNVTNMCSLNGITEFSKIKIKLHSTSETVNRTFFSQVLTSRSSIKTAAPFNLRGKLSGDRFCLEWESPLPPLLSHLQYEVNVQIKGGEQWSILKGPDCNTCVKVPPGCQFSVKVRAKPTGDVYSGNWSDWSDTLSAGTPSDTDMLLMWCVLALTLIIAVTFICFCYLHHSKLKQYFWPPVPNLEKVLQGFLSDITQQRWGPPPFTVKQCLEETTSSVVEIMSELSSSDGSVSAGEHEAGSPETEFFPDYVTLKKELPFLCFAEKSYVYEQVKERVSLQLRDTLLQTSHCSCSDIPASVKLCNNYFNHSYLAVSKSADTLNFKMSVEKDP